MPEPTKKQIEEFIEKEINKEEHKLPATLAGLVLVLVKKKIIDTKEVESFESIGKIILKKKMQEEMKDPKNKKALEEVLLVKKFSPDIT